MQMGQSGRGLLGPRSLRGPGVWPLRARKGFMGQAQMGVIRVPPDPRTGRPPGGVITPGVRRFAGGFIFGIPVPVVAIGVGAFLLFRNR